jgi:hypothetical protein
MLLKRWYLSSSWHLHMDAQAAARHVVEMRDKEIV